MPADPQRVHEVFLVAVKLRPELQADYLASACRGDAELRAEVDRRLSAHAAPDDTLGPVPAAATAAATVDTPAAGASAASIDSDATRTGTRDLGTVIAGRYTLVELIGEGGMGSVYRAEQTEPVKRQVALKLIKAGMDSRGVLARFDAERQALALMDHPNIARIYDGGVTPAGQPFFVMELVKGVPLTEYCDQQRLSVRTRLELFVSVCQAVQHAHQKGVIHRDLKPGNVLVTEVDGRPTPKVIDFGVAKATEARLTAMSFEDIGAIVGTPTYMSPEQANPTSMDIDTRTDVYALGVMLYELLTGSPPRDASQFQRGAILEMLRMVREVDPPRPSTRLTAAALPNIAANRSIEPVRLAKLFQGELDWVVMKALEKDRARRYETANAFARDIQRYLAVEVVEARPPSLGYRAHKFVKRNKAQVIAACLVFLTLVGGIVGTAFGLVEATNARDAEAEQKRLAIAAAEKETAERKRAEAAEADAKDKKSLAEAKAAEARAAEHEARDQLDLAESLSSFLRNDILAQASRRLQADARFQPTPDLTIREALDRAASTVGAKYEARPRVEASIRYTLGVAYREVSANAEAIAQLERALTLRRQHLGEDHDETIVTMIDLGQAHFAAGHLGEAVRITEQARERTVQKHGVHSRQGASASHNLAALYAKAGRNQDAIRLLESVRDQRQDADVGEDRSTLYTLSALANAYEIDRRFDDSLKILEAIHEPYARVVGADHPDTLMMLSDYGCSLCSVGRHAEGLAILEDASRKAVERLGRKSRETLLIRQNLAENYPSVGKERESVQILEEVRDDATEVLGPDHFGTLVVLHNLARGYFSLDRAEDAIELLEHVEARRVATLGIRHPETIKALKHLGFFHWMSKHFDKGAEAFAKALQGCRAQWGDAHEETCSTAFNLAFNLRDDKRPAEALTVLEQWLPRAMELQWRDTDMLRTALELGANLSMQAGRAAAAVPFLLRLVEELRTAPRENAATFDGQLTQIGTVMLRAHLFAEAEPLLREALTLREKDRPDSWQTFNSRSVLGGALLGQQKHAEAEPLLLAGYEGMKQRESMIPAQGKARLREALDRLIELYTATDRPEDVEKWRTERAKYPEPAAPSRDGKRG